MLTSLIINSKGGSNYQTLDRSKVYVSSHNLILQHYFKREGDILLPRPCLGGFHSPKTRGKHQINHPLRAPKTLSTSKQKSPTPPHIPPRFNRHATPSSLEHTLRTITRIRIQPKADRVYMTLNFQD